MLPGRTGLKVCNRCTRCIFYFLLLLSAITTLIWYFTNRTTKLEPPKHHVSASIIACGGLGNMMWRFASLYGIGRHLGRSPYFANAGLCYREHLTEFREVFDNFGDLLEFYVRF